jgi:uncharacterized secreted protein with C-terminal beta-propeller domain
VSFKRIVMAVVAIVIAAPSLAASVADRSPFAQGLWWDPTRSGEGFEMWNTAGEVAAIWYTYDDTGRPTWYIAAGSRQTLGTQAWPLLQFRWSDGVVAAPTVVGSLKLNVRHPESVEAAWQLGAANGTRVLQPLIASGIVNEVDHSGVWFDPRNDGWGMSLTEQGDVVVGVVYGYDASGAARWILGSRRGAGDTAPFNSFTGACPGCAYVSPIASPAGNLSFDMPSETDIGLRSNLTFAMAAGVNVDGARMVQLGRPASSRAADRQLASFDDPSALKTYLAAGMTHVRLTGCVVCFSAPPPGVAFSSTNLQEAGVDEADVVKSNGEYIYTYLHDGYGIRKPALRIARVSNDGALLDVRGSVPLASGADTPMISAGLFLHADRLVSITGTQAISYMGPPWVQPGAWLHGVTNVEVMSTANPELPVTRWRAQLDGHVVTSRRIGDRVYVVTRYVPYLAGFSYGAISPAGIAANAELLAATPVSDLLPKVRVDGADAVPVMAPSAIHVPPQGSREPIADMIMITAIDLSQSPIAMQTIAVVGSSEAVYASTTDLFVATSRYVSRDANGLPLPVEPALFVTDLHQIRLGADAMAIVGSASVEGMLGNDVDKAAFRMSQHQGKLRVVTSSAFMWGPTGMNRLTILEPSGVAPGMLKTVSYLPNAGRPQTLGKPNELLYGTRFVGDRLYAVTFKKIDPLYIVDLSDSGDPRIAGALELPGFSDYLHPLPNGLLLGFGKDAKPAQVSGDGPFAWYQGLQLTLFDVSDANQPREMQRVVMGKRGSDSALLKHHHAFSALAQSDGTLSIGIPASIHDGTGTPYSNDWDYYPWQYSGLMRLQLHGSTPSDASLVQLPTLVTHSSTQLPGVNDAAASSGRSVLFHSGTVYVGNGQFWHQDNAGNKSGPH